ncbi:hypothetical protein OH77DRAFT_1418497 [Trametes cingulata]|nr:hypothetical protein OH77DRAFT_1418497 [Trametes cingulata]
MQRARIPLLVSLLLHDMSEPSSTAHQQPEGICITLISPDEDLPSLTRRAVDAVRRGWTLEADSPCGVYLSGDDLVLHDIDPADGATASQTSMPTAAGTEGPASPGPEDSGVHRRILKLRGLSRTHISNP